MKNFKKILSVFALTTFVIIALGFLASNAKAACDAETGASYGLCIAYCEAMDCDNPLLLSHPVGCDKVNGRYMQINDADIECGCTIDFQCSPATPKCCDGVCVELNLCE